MSMRAGFLGNYVYNNVAANSSIQDIATNGFLKMVKVKCFNYQFSSPQYFQTYSLKMHHS